MTTRNALHAALGCGIVLFALLACNKKQAPESWTVKEPNLTGRAYKLTVAGAGPCQVKSSTDKPASGEITVGFDVIMEPTGEQKIGIYPTYVNVIDGQGHRYQPDFDGGCQPALDYHRYVGKNEKHRGWFSVNVPEATKTLTVVMQWLAAGSSEHDEVRFEAHRGTR
jgi:hypothetical protein